MRRPALENDSRPERDMAKPADATMTTTTEELHEQLQENPPLDSKYRLILVAAQRSKQLQRGARPRVELDTQKHKPTRIALEEVQQGVVNYSFIERE
jgi:DNA-directed RNA polymerase omega subunit